MRRTNPGQELLDNAHGRADNFPRPLLAKIGYFIKHRAWPLNADFPKPGGDIIESKRDQTRTDERVLMVTELDDKGQAIRDWKRIEDFGGGLVVELQELVDVGAAPANDYGVVTSEVRETGTGHAVRVTSRLPGGKMWPLLVGTELDQETGTLVQVSKQFVPAGRRGVLMRDGDRVICTEIQPHSDVRSIAVGQELDELPADIILPTRVRVQLPTVLIGGRITGTERLVFTPVFLPSQEGVIRGRVRRKHFWGPPADGDLPRPVRWQTSPLSLAVEYTLTRAGRSWNTGESVSMDKSSSQGLSDSRGKDYNKSANFGKSTSESDNYSEGGSQSSGTSAQSGTSTNTSTNHTISNGTGTSVSDTINVSTSHSSGSSTTNSTSNQTGVSDSTQSGTNSNSSTSNSLSRTISSGVGTNQSASTGTESNRSQSEQTNFGTSGTSSTSSASGTNRSFNTSTSSTTTTNFNSSTSASQSYDETKQNSESNIQVIKVDFIPKVSPLEIRRGNSAEWANRLSASKVNSNGHGTSTANGNSTNIGTSSNTSINNSNTSSSSTSNGTSITSGTHSSTNQSSSTTTNDSTSDSRVTSNSTSSSSGTSHTVNSSTSSGLSTSRTVSDSVNNSQGHNENRGRQSSDTTSTSSSSSTQGGSSTSTSTGSNTNWNENQTANETYSMSTSKSKSMRLGGNNSVGLSSRWGTQASEGESLNESKDFLEVQLPACLRPSLTLRSGDVEVKIPATVPACYPINQWFVLNVAQPRHWRMGIYLVDIVEAIVDAD